VSEMCGLTELLNFYQHPFNSVHQKCQRLCKISFWVILVWNLSPGVKSSAEALEGKLDAGICKGGCRVGMKEGEELSG